MVVMQNMEVRMVTTISWKGVLTFLMRLPSRDSTAPIFWRMPPKPTAMITRLLVQSMLSMPPRFNRVSHSSLAVSAE